MTTNKDTSNNKNSAPKNTDPKKTKINGQPKTGRAISDPKEVAQLVMMRIDQVNSKKDELTIAVKTLADTAKQLANVYARQQTQINQLTKKVEELEKSKK